MVSEIILISIHGEDRPGVTASVTGEISPEALIMALPEGAAPSAKEMSYSLDIPAKQGVVIPAGVSYSAMAFPDNSADTAVRTLPATT